MLAFKKADSHCKDGKTRLEGEPEYVYNQA